MVTPAGGAEARLTPYELVFADAGFETRVFPLVEREAEARGIDPRDRDRFAFLPSADEAVRGIVPEAAPPEALEQFRALFYHAFNFWRFGRRLYLVTPPVARYLVESPPDLGDWELRLPHPSLYVQLPANLFWASVSPAATPEPVDGFFAVSVAEEDPLGPPYRQLETLLVLGLRRGRTGFSVIPIGTEVGAGIARVWCDTPGREGARDFDNILPGGEMDGLYSILTTTEALKLLARTVWYARQSGEEVIAVEPLPDADPTTAPRSRLAYQLLRLPSPADPAG